MSNHQAYLPYMTNSLAIRQEIQRFESVHPSIYAIYDLIELVPDPLLAQQIREHVVCIEGKQMTTKRAICLFRNIAVVAALVLSLVSKDWILLR